MKSVLSTSNRLAASRPAESHKQLGLHVTLVGHGGHRQCILSGGSIRPWLNTRKAVFLRYLTSC